MKSINLQRTESLLLELVPEALSNLSDTRINSLAITAIDCKNGKYDATVYYDGSDYSKQEQQAINTLLAKANGHIKSYCLNATGWYKCPNFKFKADDSLEHNMKIEALFEQIKSKD
ncbi:30S ribosome-binding factor RbfA [Malaciobacter mytili]|uniref:Ribosome-binding factor A n=1 Tax=Malaciobacter mytili LMG 24559 TaxID=1032238 RepID=A0AAX2AIK7_9BACT|nr:30S ribosome-binding factor RbfA [Malaciobacter mytili]AXH13958.1 ribosome-binding factor A [Malaciobacter mytili LMG 24559]RXI48431.1 ribosome-binding factor A [Malaciobacter mytili]RXK15873.1 ribosome-binding factor A [Malaciobacter mytili LMG 24559]